MTQHVGGLCLAVMLLDGGYEMAVSVGTVGARDVRWFRLADDAIRAEVWRTMGRHIEVWARGGVVQRVGMQ